MTVQDFKNYVLNWAKEINVDSKISSIHIRKMKNKIASCSSRGRISFDPDVLHYPQQEMNQVIIHELLHLRYKNHNRMFKLMWKNYMSRNITP